MRDIDRSDVIQRRRHQLTVRAKRSAKRFYFWRVAHCADESEWDFVPRFRFRVENRNVRIWAVIVFVCVFRPNLLPTDSVNQLQDAILRRLRSAERAVFVDLFAQHDKRQHLRAVHSLGAPVDDAVRRVHVHRRDARALRNIILTRRV